MLAGIKVERAALPWADPGEGDLDEEEESTGESSVKKGLKAKLTKARNEVKRLEKELSGKKTTSKGAKAKGKLGGAKKKKKKRSSPEAKRKKKKKKGKASPSPGGEKTRSKGDGGDRGRGKESREVKDKRKSFLLQSGGGRERACLARRP